MRAICAPLVAALLLAAAPLQAQESTPAPEPEADQDHKGFLFRLTIGLGCGWMQGDGTLEPAIGLRRVDDPHHVSPAVNLSIDLGGGFKDLGIHVGGVYERMLLRADDPTAMGLTILGVGGGLSYYFTEHDLYATAQFRYYGLRLYLPDVPCDADVAEKWQSYQGPGFTVGLGKEWFGENDRGLGLGIQVNYGKLRNGSWAAIDYVSLMLAITFTKF
jgi:hypothetical protein